MTYTEQAIIWAGYHPSMIKSLEKLLITGDFWKRLAMTIQRSRKPTGVAHYRAWRSNRNRLLDWLDAGKDAESFFKDLLAKD